MGVMAFCALFLDGFVDEFGLGHLCFHSLVTAQAEVPTFGDEQVFILGVMRSVAGSACSSGNWTMNNVLVGGPFFVALLAEFGHRCSTEESLVGPTVRIVAREAVACFDRLVYDRSLGDSLLVAELAQFGLLPRKLESMFFNAAYRVAGVAGIDVHRSV